MNETKVRKSGGFAAGCVVAAAVLVIAMIASFGALYYYGFVKSGGVYDDLREQLAQSQLDQLIVYVELHVAQNEAPPNRLEDIEKFIPDNVPVMITDASAPPLGPPRNYFYHRIDDEHYILRSVGADDVPCTEDDIVPKTDKLNSTSLVVEVTQAECEAYSKTVPVTEN